MYVYVRMRVRESVCMYVCVCESVSTQCHAYEGK